MRTLTAPQARCTRLACFGTQLRGAPQRPSSLCPMRAVKLNAFAVLKLASACHVSQNISSKLWGAHRPPPPVRQKPTFTHEVLFQRLPCVRTPLSRTKFTFTASRASEATFHARSSPSTLPVRQKPLSRTDCDPTGTSGKTTWPKPTPNQSPPPWPNVPYPAQEDFLFNEEEYKKPSGGTASIITGITAAVFQ